MAAWTAVEMWGTFGSDVAVAISPVGEGRFEVYLDGEVVFDRKAEGGIYPEMHRMREIKGLIREKIQVSATA